MRCSTSRRRAREKRIAVRVEVDPEVTVEADPLAVERILTTLMRNAVKFTPEDGEISIGAVAIGELVHFIVEDNGPGITAEDVARLGRPFEQGDVVMANGMKGSGLGLAIANSLVELHGGTLRLQSRAGRGRGGGRHPAEGPARPARDRDRPRGVSERRAAGGRVRTDPALHQRDRRRHFAAQRSPFSTPAPFFSTEPPPKPYTAAPVRAVTPLTAAAAALS